MKRVLIAILVAVLLTLVLFALAGLLGGACHCVTPTTLFFPYGAIILGLSAESISFLAMAIQFPLYAVVLVKANGRERRIVALVLLIAFHVAAAMVSLKLYYR